jgi:hypothetical protein
VVGEIMAFHFRDSPLVDGKIDSNTIRSIARIGGPNYATLETITRMKPIGQTPKTVLTPGPSTPSRADLQTTRTEDQRYSW